MEGLAINETAIEFYNTEIKPILSLGSQKELVYDYKNLVGNVFNFETIFRDEMWNYEMNMEFQNKHQIIIAKYRTIYASNVLKWQESLAKLNK